MRTWWKEMVVTHLRQHPCDFMKGLKKTTKISVIIRTRNRKAGFGVLCTNEWSGLLIPVDAGSGNLPHGRTQKKCVITCVGKFWELSQCLYETLLWAYFCKLCFVGRCRLSFKRNITPDRHMTDRRPRSGLCRVTAHGKSAISTLQFTWLNHRLRRTCVVLKRRETCVTWQSRREIEKSFVTESCIRKTYEERGRYRNKLWRFSWEFFRTQHNLYKDIYVSKFLWTSFNYIATRTW